MTVNKSEWSQLLVVSKKKSLQTDLLSSYDEDDDDTKLKLMTSMVMRVIFEIYRRKKSNFNFISKLMKKIQYFKRYNLKLCCLHLQKDISKKLKEFNIDET